ncbi:DISARM system helicase DrmA [Actinomyces bowdenii]|uniref:DISARM system helicase DrmA n=1 Tax=Actinomyces bowdenii TaxID=131109 RepID=UPI00214BE742|nr:DISARM system helicase DrmA [Actinomyces bowdenii]MCR2053090.1 DISARM system helicase DrmA [Actinomyces bowdenii]
MSETMPRASTRSGADSAVPHSGIAYVFDEEPTPTSASARAGLLEVLRRELLGPAEGDREVLTTQPSQRYLLGRIAPTRLDSTAETPATEASDDNSEGVDPLDAAHSTGVPVTGSEEDTLDATAEEDPGGDTDDEPVRRGLMIPASMGLRFQVPAHLEAINIHVSWGTYETIAKDATTSQTSADTRYQRVPHAHSLRLESSTLTPGRTEDCHLEGDVILRIDSHLDEPDGRFLIELALCNDRTTSRRIPTEAWMFQTRIDVDADGRAVFFPVHDPTIPPAPGSGPRPEPGSEEARLDLQYRDRLEFAVGRTCSADWSLPPTDPDDGAPRRAVQVRTTWIPTVETPQTTAADVPGALLDMHALAAAASAPNSPGALRVALGPIASAYGTWLDEQAAIAADLPEHLRETAEEALAEARQVLDQLAEGMDHLTADTAEGAEARRCFAFMNRVMADQRVHSQIAATRAAGQHLSIEEAEDRVLAGAYPRHWRVFQLAFILMQLPALADPAAQSRAGDLATVELLFFPTGGGKTEAYLGLAAYAFAIRRRQGLLTTPDGPIDGRAGVTVLMRYTLRLLTSQQFQRATTLVCAAELARREDPDTWGSEPFRIGLWVGTAVSPKRVREASEELQRLRDHPGRGAGHRFSALQLGHCPWCGLPLTPNDVTVGDMAGMAERVVVRCPDPYGDCPFSAGDHNIPDGLPVLTTDEEIYRLAPAFVIATVDKLARLAREGHASTLFGHVARRCERHGYVPALDHRGSSDYVGCALADNGRHHAKAGLPAATIRPATRLRPPDLIIQDELHLITGALGTSVGLFETAVDTMCTWTAPDGRPAAPLLVASSATVRKAADQVRLLYGRDLTIFPPQVLDASDTFFSRVAPVDAEHPGRLYVGLSTTGVRLTAAEIQVTQVLMAGAQLLLDRVGQAADPYMTLVGYFSATRELAGMARYVQDDIQTGLAKPSRDTRLPRRRGTDFGALHLGELTSRIASTDITATLGRMGLTFTPDIDSTAAKDAAMAATRAGRKVQRREAVDNPYDVVLATSMLQVGVDVSRLGLMLVVGQPKNTAEYIQATSRVGRESSRPGLVVALGNWARPRDLAHYEQFRHFHETFYARVEPLSVTPFSVTAVDRGLDGALVAAARVTQAATPKGLNPEHDAGNASTQQEALDKLASALIDRATAAGGEDAARYTAGRLEARLSEWMRRGREVTKRGGELVYERGADDARFFALLRSAESGGGHAPQRDEAPFVVAGSMREVQPEINLLVSPDPSRLVDRAPEDGPAWQRQEPAGADSADKEEKQ